MGSINKERPPSVGVGLDFASRWALETSRDRLRGHPKSGDGGRWAAGGLPGRWAV